MANYLPVRRSGHARRRKPVKRASRRFSEVQVAALAVMVGCLALAGALVVAPAFRISQLRVEGARFTSRAAIEAVTGLQGTPPTAFGFRSDLVAERLVRLPAVERASVDVRLPATLVVTVTERQPKLIWTIGSRRYVIDETGLLFGYADDAGRPVESDAGPMPEISASASPSPPPATPTATATGKASPSATLRPAPSLGPAPSGVPVPSLTPPKTADQASTDQGGLSLPLVVDRRAADAGLTLGDTIDPITADAAYRIASLRPGDVGSAASRLVVVIDDTNGITLMPASGGWVADFGFFTSRRTPDGVPSQARALHALFDGVGEAKVSWIFLLGDVPGGQDSYLPR